LIRRKRMAEQKEIITAFKTVAKRILSFALIGAGVGLATGGSTVDIVCCGCAGGLVGVVKSLIMTQKCYPR
jgi:hypothetical protein